MLDVYSLVSASTSNHRIRTMSSSLRIRYAYPNLTAGKVDDALLQPRRDSPRDVRESWRTRRHIAAECLPPASRAELYLLRSRVGRRDRASAILAIFAPRLPNY